MSNSERNDSTDPHNDTERAELLEIRKKYGKILKKFHKEYRTWRLSLGPIRVKAALSSQHIALIFAFWHAFAGAAGILVFIFWQAGRPLGIALVVGSLFGMGSFVSQVWSQAMNKERDLHNKLWQEEQMEFVRELMTEVNDIDERLAKLNETRNDKS